MAALDLSAINEMPITRQETLAGTANEVREIILPNGAGKVSLYFATTAGSFSTDPANNDGDGSITNGVTIPAQQWHEVTFPANRGHAAAAVYVSSATTSEIVHIIVEP